MLQEAGVDLVKILDEEGFYQRTRVLSSTPKAPTPSRTPGKRAQGQHKQHAADGGPRAPAAAGAGGAGSAVPPGSGRSAVSGQRWAPEPAVSAQEPAVAGVAVASADGKAAAVHSDLGGSSNSSSNGSGSGQSAVQLPTDVDESGALTSRTDGDAGNGNGVAAAGAQPHSEASSHPQAHGHENGHEHERERKHAHNHSRAHSHGHEQPKTAQGFGAATPAAPAAQPGGSDSETSGAAPGNSRAAVSVPPPQLLRSAGINFGSAAGPLQMPTDRELELALEQGGLKTLRQLVSCLACGLGQELAL